MLQLLYLQKDVFVKEVQYEGKLYTAIFWNIPLEIGSTFFYSLLDDLTAETFPYRVILLKIISLRFCAPNNIQWQLLVTNYNLKITSKFSPGIFITPDTSGIIIMNITVRGLYRDVSPPYT